MRKQKSPPGWDQQRGREVLAHYENQSEDEQSAQIEAAREAEGITMMAVLTELAPEVRALIARKQSFVGWDKCSAGPPQAQCTRPDRRSRFAARLN